MKPINKIKTGLKLPILPSTCLRLRCLRLRSGTLVLTLSSTLTLFISCMGQDIKIQESDTEQTSTQYQPNNDPVQPLIERFAVPEGFVRKSASPGSFAYYLQHLPLKSTGSFVQYYDGRIKTKEVYAAVVAMDISNKNLQQCADAVIRLRGEYFFKKRAFDQINFSLTNGFEMPYEKWADGYRVQVNGNETNWVHTTSPSKSYSNFRQYLEFVFAYAGTLSLSKSLHSKNISQLEIGDVFIVGGSPGHAVIVVDLAENTTGDKLFMLAQSYMPAQETQILKNFENPELSPWYKIPTNGILHTPEWQFETHQLKTWD